jgi:DNA topoisomerase-3
LWKLYDFITRYFIATLCENAVIEKKVYRITCENFTFEQESIKIIKKGFLEIADWINYEKNIDFPTLSIFQSLYINEISYEEKLTESPNLLTESELIKLMYDNRIGTNGSIPNHINKIIERKYLNIIGGRWLQATILGIAFIESLKSVDETLVLPKTRADIEESVNKISKVIKLF